MRNTKIIATLGTKGFLKETLLEMIYNGLSVVRINMSHCTPESCKELLKFIREIEIEKNIKIPIGLDTKGPELRIKNLKEPLQVIKDEKIYLINTDSDKETCSNLKFLEIPFKTLFKLQRNNLLFVDDGNLILEVEEIKNHFVVAKARSSFLIKPRKKINIPGINLGLEFLSTKDIEDISFGLENKVDYIFSSFVSRKEDLESLKKFIENHSRHKPLIISKIESVEGMKNLDEIIEHSDGIMMARGDLAVEIGLPNLFSAQKIITEKVNRSGKILICATQMLESMIENPTPTRAEITDIGNAVLDGVDCVMLSGETAVGRWPVESIKMMNDVCLNAEKFLSVKGGEVPGNTGLIVLRSDSISEVKDLFRIFTDLPISVLSKNEEISKTFFLKKNFVGLVDEVPSKCILVEKRENFFVILDG